MYPGNESYVPSVPLAKFTNIKVFSMIEHEQELRFITDIATFRVTTLDLIDEENNIVLASRTLQ